MTLVAWVIRAPGDGHRRPLAPDLPRQCGQPQRCRAPRALRRPPGPGPQPARVRLPRLRRERAEARAKRDCIATRTRPMGTCGTRSACRPSASSSSATRSGPRWRWSWRPGCRPPGLVLDGALMSVDRTRPGGVPVRAGALGRPQPVRLDREDRPGADAEAVSARAAGRRGPDRPRTAAVRRRATAPRHSLSSPAATATRSRRTRRSISAPSPASSRPCTRT